MGAARGNLGSAREWETRYHDREKAALNRLWTRDSELLKKRAMRLAYGDGELAEDALGDTYEKLGKPAAMKAYDPTKSWTAYAKKTLERATIDLLRRRREAAPLEIDPVDPGSIEPERERDLMVEEAIANLEPAERIILRLLYWRRWTQKEIAWLLEVSAATVNRRHARAQEQLRDYLEPKIGGGLEP